MPIALIATILSAIGAIVGAVVDTGKAVLDLLGVFFQNVFSLIQTFVQSAPTPMKVFVFLFFLVTLGNIFSSFALTIRYACDGNSALYETEDIGSAMMLMVKTQFQGISVGDRNTYIHNNYDFTTQQPSPSRVKCTGATPRLYFYSVDIFDYKLWLLILVITFGLPMVWGYYSKMGALPR